MSKFIFNSKIFRSFITILCCVTLMIPSQLLFTSKAIADENVITEENWETEEIVVEDENFDVVDDLVAEEVLDFDENLLEEESDTSTNSKIYSVELRTVNSSMGLIEDETGTTFDNVNINVFDQSPYTYDPFTGVMTYVNTDGVTKTFRPHPLEGYDFQIWSDRHGEPPAEEQGIVESNLSYRAYFISNAPIWGNTIYTISELGESMGWTEGQTLSSTYTLPATKSDPEIETDQYCELYGNNNMTYKTVNGEKAIVYESNTQQDSGFIKIPTIENYDIKSVSYRICAYNSTSQNSDVACVISTSPYYDEEQEWWDWKIPAYNEWWITEFNPDYVYVPQDSAFYINAWRVRPTECLALSAIGVTYTKKIPKCEVSGKVLDKNNNPVKDVVVSSVTPNSSIKTDAEGNWNLIVPAINDITFLFTKNGYYESYLHANLEGYLEFRFEQPYIIQEKVTCSFEWNKDSRHEAFNLEVWEDGVCLSISDYMRISQNFPEGATVTLLKNNKLHVDYIDLNNNKHLEYYVTAKPKESFYFAGWDFTYSVEENTVIKPGDIITLDVSVGDYNFNAIYSDTPPSPPDPPIPPIPPIPPSPDNPQVNVDMIGGQTQTGDCTVLTFLSLAVCATVIMYFRRKLS